MTNHYDTLSPAQRVKLLKWSIPFLLKEVKRKLFPLRVLYIANPPHPPGKKNFTPVPWFLIGNKVCFPVFVGRQLLGFVVVPCALNPKARKEVKALMDRLLSPPPALKIPPGLTPL